MIRDTFLINSQFLVDPSSNLIKDKTNNTETRVEPRIMDLLCLLAAKPGETVNREELVSIIWKDYGGGDEGLTQGISALRKFLADSDKELIRTIPKRGYSLNAKIEPFEKLQTSSLPKGQIKSKSLFILFSTLVILISLFIIFNPFSKKQPAKDKKEVSFPGINPSTDNSEETDKNTIITKGADSSVYKLVVIGDQPPRFYINNELLPVDKWEPYQSLINNLKKQLRERTNH